MVVVSYASSLKEAYESGRSFLNNLKMLSLTANLGDSRSIASPSCMPVPRMPKLSEKERNEVNITAGLIRISVGLEHRDDILNDILQALDNC
jgi:O-succinylhomoserine sulfhydrylase